MYLIIIGVLVVTFLANRLKNSRTGKAWFAINLDETVALLPRASMRFHRSFWHWHSVPGLQGLQAHCSSSRNQFTGPDDHAMMVSVNVLV